MAISFVGSHVGSHASTSAQTVNFSSLLDASGATPTLQQNDLVIVTVFQAGVATRTQAQLQPTGYSPSHASVLTASDTNIASQQTSQKFMGVTPDTTISIPASASTTAGVAYEIHVFRGVDTTTPMDVTPTTATGTNTAIPNPPSITPTTARAWIYCVGGGAMAAGAAPQSAAPTGLFAGVNAWRQTVLTTTTNDPGLGAGYKSDWVSGAFDCPVFTGYTSTNTGAWCAATLALRPAAVGTTNGFTFVAAQRFSNAYASATVSRSFSFGTGHRIVALSFGDAASRTVSSFTINGNAAVRLDTGNDTDGIQFWADTSGSRAGASETVSVTFSDTVDSVILGGITVSSTYSITPTAQSRLAAASLADPKTYASSITGPASGGIIAFNSFANPVDIIPGNGTEIGELLDTSAWNFVAFGAGAVTPNWSTGTQSGSSGVALAFGPPVAGSRVPYGYALILG